MVSSGSFITVRHAMWPANVHLQYDNFFRSTELLPCSAQSEMSRHDSAKCLAPMGAYRTQDTRFISKILLNFWSGLFICLSHNLQLPSIASVCKCGNTSLFLFHFHTAVEYQALRETSPVGMSESRGAGVACEVSLKTSYSAAVLEWKRKELCDRNLWSITDCGETGMLKLRGKCNKETRSKIQASLVKEPCTLRSL